MGRSGSLARATMPKVTMTSEAESSMALKIRKVKQEGEDRKCI